MPMYDVHLYDVVRVKVACVVAASPKEAVARAMAAYRPQELYEQVRCSCSVGNPAERPQEAMHLEHVEYAGETTEVLVDTAGDTEFTQSAWYDTEGDQTSPRGAA